MLLASSRDQSGALELLTKIPYWASCALLTFAGAYSDVAVRYDPE